MPRIIVWAVVLGVVVGGDPDPALSLMLIALAGVVTIVSDSRFAIERRLDDLGVPTREAWVPILMLGLMLGLDLVQTSNITHVIRDKGPVLVFILGFALVAEGLRRSGFIHFLAYRLAARGGANTTRLTLYLFLLSSLLTYFTSNDIVVLTMTPIVMSVAYQARIGNAKLLLLSQFIAANTVSMGILIGSPTNLILGRVLGIHFVEYFFLMLAPSVMALMGTFAFVMWINRFVERRAETGGRVIRALVGSWTFSPTYSPPRFSEYRSFTPHMRLWVSVFSLSVLLLAIGTATNTGLLIAAVLITLIALVALWRDTGAPQPRPDQRTGLRFAAQMIRVLPFGIVFFGITYFVIADALADTRFVTNEVDEYVTEHASSHTPVPSWGSILASGVLVNTMNDLPASALTGEVLEGAEFATPFDRSVVVQGTLAGLNIATYVTPVGALAGIIWFDLLVKEKRRRRRLAEEGLAAAPIDVVIPRRQDLVVYGSATFLFMTLILGATNFAFVALADALLGPPTGGTEYGAASTHVLWMIVCFAVVVAVIVAFRRVLASAGVALAHLGDVLVVLTRVRLWASRHRLLAAGVFAGFMFVSSGVLLYWSEDFHTRHYGRNRQFEGPGEFVTWLVVFVSSGFEKGEFPRSTLGNVLAALLALGSIAALVVLVRISTASGDLTLRRKLGRGEVPSDRLVIVNCTEDNRELVRTMVGEPSRFLTIATRDPDLERSFDLRDNDRVDVITFTQRAADLVTDLRLDEARELVLLSRSVADDFDNLGLLTTLDGVLAGAAATQALPGVVAQLHEEQMPGLLDQRLRGDLREAVMRPPFEQVTRAFVVADVAGWTDELHQLHVEPIVGRSLVVGVDAHVELRGLEDLFAVDDDPASAATATATDQQQSGSVQVVGGGTFAQACALDLVGGGVTAVRLLVPHTKVLLPDLAAVAGITVVRCDDELQAASAALEQPGATLVVEDGERQSFDSEQLLEELSVARLHEQQQPEANPRLVVCCRGSARAKWMRNFLVDKVLDVTRVEASYFAVFATVYFDVLLHDEEVANWPAVRQLGVAHRVASLLCHLDVARRGQLRGERLGSLRFAIDHDDEGRPVVAVEATTSENGAAVPNVLDVGLLYG